MIPEFVVITLGSVELSLISSKIQLYGAASSAALDLSAKQGEMSTRSKLEEHISLYRPLQLE